MKKNEMYAYLARRDKKGVKIITSFPHNNTISPTRIDPKNLRSMNMDTGTHSKVFSEAHSNRMEYELYFETADSFESLRKSLAKRGYSKIPNHKTSSMNGAVRINDHMLLGKESTMIRRGSSVR